MLIALRASCLFETAQGRRLPRTPTLRSFVAYAGLFALRASCLFETAQGILCSLFIYYCYRFTIVCFFLFAGSQLLVDLLEDDIESWRDEQDSHNTHEHTANDGEGE